MRARSVFVADCLEKTQAGSGRFRIDRPTTPRSAARARPVAMNPLAKFPPQLQTADKPTSYDLSSSPGEGGREAWAWCPTSLVGRWAFPPTLV